MKQQKSDLRIYRKFGDFTEEQIHEAIHLFGLSELIEEKGQIIFVVKEIRLIGRLLTN